jgi:plasmid stability protein
MAQVLIRNLSNDVVERLRRRAAAKGHSLEQELREIVTAAAPLSRAERVAIIDHFQALSKRRPKRDATDLIREDRDRR